MNFNKLFSLVEHPEFFGNAKLDGANVLTSPTTYIVGEVRGEFWTSKQV